MPSLKTINGHNMYFDPDAITEVTDYDDDSQTRVTCVYGIGGTAAVRIEEPVLRFLSRVGIEDKFAKLTRKNNMPTWIRVASVSSLRAAIRGDSSEQAQTVVTINSSVTRGVIEPLVETLRALHERGAIWATDSSPDL